MNRKLALGIFALTATFAGSAMAKDFDPNRSGIQAVTISNKAAPDNETHDVVRRPLKGNNKTDSVFWIQKSRGSKEWLTTDGKKVFWGADKKNWTFHKNTSGWSLMVHGTEALVVSIVEGKMVLQGNAGQPHQVFEIKGK